jgi:NAD(P)-dependent dehydrogenase (short-subunit alcohol dehydrogenase family)
VRHVLITGTNRGIGHALARLYAQQSETHVLATARPGHDQAVAALASIASKHGNPFSVVHLDVTDAESIQQATKQIAEVTSKLDVLILNAGINPEVDQDVENIKADTMRQVFEVNTLAPLMLTQAFLPLLRKDKGAKIAYISSDMASLTGRTYGDSNAYCMSKAALNMIMRGAAAELKSDGIMAIALDPGWVKTDMGGPHASLSPDESARGILGVMDRLKMQDSGQFWRWDGQKNDW